MEGWYNFYKSEKGEKISGVLIGNKSDKENKVSHEDAKKFAKKYNLEYYDTSAKNDTGLKIAIVHLLSKIIESKTHYQSLDSIGPLEPQNNNINFQLDPAQLNDESFCSRFCRKLNPVNWFK